MAVDVTGAPAAIRALVGGLAREGFELRRDDGGGAVNRVVELSLGRCTVRLTADRGQWWVELGGEALGDWFDADVWASCLDGAPVATEPAGLDAHAGVVLRRWRDVAHAIDAVPDIRRCLERARSTRSRTRLGQPPPAAGG